MFERRFRLGGTADLPEGFRSSFAKFETGSLLDRLSVLWDALVLASLL